MPDCHQRVARACECRGTGRLGMLAHQGALALDRWTGNPAPLRAMGEGLGFCGGEFFLDKPGGAGNMVVRARCGGARLDGGD